MYPKRVGTYFVEKGLIDSSQKEQILDHCQRTGLRFGDAAQDLGFVSHHDLMQAFGPNYNIDFFYLDPSHYPATTKEAFPLNEMLKHGILPLGFKSSQSFFRRGKYLNIGFLDPGSKENQKTIELLAKKNLTSENVLGIKIFLILADQFVDVLKEVYQQPEETLPAAKELHPILSNYLKL